MVQILKILLKKHDLIKQTKGGTSKSVNNLFDFLLMRTLNKNQIDNYGV